MFEDVFYKLEELILAVWKEGGSELIFHFQFGVSMLMILMKWILSCYCWKYMIDNFVGKMFSDNFYENFEWIFYLQIDKGFHISSYNQHFYKLLKLRRQNSNMTRIVVTHSFYTARHMVKLSLSSQSMIIPVCISPLCHSYLVAFFKHCHCEIQTQQNASLLSLFCKFVFCCRVSNFECKQTDKKLFWMFIMKLGYNINILY